MRTRPLQLHLLLAALLASRAFAQVPETPDVPADVPPAVEEPSVIIKDAEPQSGSASKSADAGKLSVDFPNEDIRTILSNVGDLFELNLVIPETLQGRTTIKLRDVSWRQIFDVVLSPVGYNYVEEGNIIKIVSNETLQMEPVSTEVFVLNYARAQDIQPTLATLVDPAAGGRIVVDARSNALVITERPSRMNRIRPIIEQLDHATDQVMIETKFVEVTDRAVKNVGINWASAAEYEVSAGPFKQDFQQTDGRDIAHGTSGTALDFTDQLTRVRTAVFSADQFQVVLSALQTQNDTKIVSNPTVVTLNNIEATINVGEEFPIPSYTYNQERGTFEVSGFEYRPIGINLRVTPQVNAAGFIKLLVEPEVSQRSGESTFSGAAIPIIATRKARTQVSLKDGHTMGIGGLIRNEKGLGSTKVPVLGNIPVVGRMFRSDSKDETITNLLIFITARSVAADGAPVEEIFDPRQIRQMNLTRDELPGYRNNEIDPFLPSTQPSATSAVPEPAVEEPATNP